MRKTFLSPRDPMDIRQLFTGKILRRISSLIILTNKHGEIIWVNHHRTRLAKSFVNVIQSSIFDHPLLYESGIGGRIKQLYDEKSEFGGGKFSSTIHGERVEVELIPLVRNKRVISVATIIEEKKSSQAPVSILKAIESFIDLMPQMVIFVDDSYKIVMANKAFVDYFNISYAQLSFCSLFSFVFQEDQSRLKRQIDSCFHDQQQRRFAVEMDPGGNLSFSLSCVSYGSGQEYVLLQSTNSGPIFHQCQVDKVRYLSQFAGRIAHDLNNALGPVINQLVLLRNDLGSGNDIHELQNHIDIMQKHSKRISEIIDDIGDLKNHKRDDVSKDKLENIIHQAILIADIQRPHKSVRITTNYPPDLPLIECCEARIEKAIFEIIMNGLEACGETGQVHINVDYINAGKEKFSIRISDTGKGIPRGRHEKIFEPFYTTKDEKWAGLGLTIAMGIITSHNGFLKVMSEVKDGTVITVELPRRYTEMQV
jgi:signal transduction histidine kinase